MPGGFRRKRAREQQRVRVDGNGLMREVIGNAGLGDEDLAALGQRLDDRSAILERQRRPGFAALPAAKGELRRTLQLAEQMRGGFEDLVVLGSGDLALGIRALTAAVAPPGSEAGPTPGALRLHVAAELDPESFAALLTRLDLRRTLFNVVGGGGEGLPTMGHFLIVRDRLLKELGALAYKNHVVITTGSEGPLRQIVNDEGFRDLPLPIAGEDAFVLLTAGALFPAACAGLEIAQVVAGAADMAERCRAHDGGMTPAHLLAVGISLAGASGPRVAVPALASLRPLAAWIERRCGGWTPADVSGAHPGAGGVALFLAVDRCHHELEIPKAYQDIESVGYLGGQGLGALAALASEAAELALWSTGTPTMTLRCPEIDAHVAGQVCYLVEAAAAVARATCDAAPAERDGGERFAYGLVGRPGYEAERAEVQRLAARREARYVA